MALRFGGRVFATVASLLSLSLTLPAGAVPSRALTQAAAQPVVLETASTAQNWDQRGYAPTHDGFNPLETVLSPSNVSGLTPLWSFNTGGQINGPTIVHGGVSYVTSFNGSGYILYALNAATGALIWSFNVGAGGGNETGSPAFGGGRVYVGCNVDSAHIGICALQPSTGKLLWTAAVFSVGGGPVTSTLNAPPVYAQGAVYFAAGTSGDSGHTVALVAVNATSGARLWTDLSNSGPNMTAAPPAVANGTVYYGLPTQDRQGNFVGGVCAFKTSNGSDLWCTNLNGDTGVAVALTGSLVFANGTQGKTYALNAATGAIVWAFAAPGNQGSPEVPPAVARGIVYVADGGIQGSLYALGANTGKLLWTYTANSNGPGSSASVANGVVYFNCATTCALNARTGAPLASFGPGSGATHASPAIVKGVVYTVCGYNSACAYALPAMRALYRPR